MRTYEVEIGFCGFVGVSNTYEVEAESREDAEVIAIEMAVEDLTIEHVELVTND